MEDTIIEKKSLITDEILNNEIVFDSLDKLHKIIIKIDSLSNFQEYCWFNIEIFNEHNCKTFLILIKDVTDYINKKNIKYIKQYICLDDCLFFKKSEIIKYNGFSEKNKLHNLPEDIFIVTTKIEYFIEELINVLGIKIL
jgi:hypothetical protein